jgi:putative ABC transport system ATP-binding protein
LNTTINTLAVKISHLQFSWPGQTPLIKDLSLALDAGESLFISGPSGCGKSTLLNILAGVIPVQEGKIWIHGRLLSELSNTAKDQLRGEEMGFIFQQFNLIPYLSVTDNILLPTYLYPKRLHAAVAQHGSVTHALQYLVDRLGLSQSLLQQAAHQLSIGQQQRVAAARAFIGKPSIVIADEPTSSLDWNNQSQLMDLFLGLADEQNTALMMVSHDERLSPRFDHTLAVNQCATEC